jgi:hypothetical protein
MVAVARSMRASVIFPSARDQEPKLGTLDTLHNRMGSIYKVTFSRFGTLTEGTSRTVHATTRTVSTGTKRDHFARMF